MRNISPRNQKILDMLILEQKAKVEIAEYFGISKQRVQQIVDKYIPRNKGRASAFSKGYKDAKNN